MIDYNLIPKEVLAYLAGLIDGEGYIGIKKSKYRRRIVKDCVSANYHERIQIRMVNEEAIKLFKETLGGNYYHEKRPYSKSQKQLFCYQASDLRASQILKKLLPYLRVKRRDAELVLKLRKSKEDKRSFRRGSPARRPMPKDVVNYREALYQEVKHLHGH